MADITRAVHNSIAAWTDLVKVLVFGALTLVVLAVSIFNPYLGIVTLGLLVAGLILGFNLKWGILSLVFLLPFDPQVEVKPGFFVYFDLLFVLPALAYLWKVVFGNLRVRWASLALVPYVLFAIGSTVWRAEDLFWFAGYSVRLIIAVLFMAVIAAVGEAETITSVLGATLVPQVVYGIYQLLVDGPGPLYLLIYPHYQGQEQVWGDRARGLFFTENNFGSYCATVLVMVLALGLRTKSAGLRLFCYIMGGLGLLGLAISGSRGAWLAAVVGLIVLFMYSRASWGAKLALVTVAALAILASQSLDYAPLARTQTLDAFTVESRTAMYLAALFLFVQHPVIGVGLTNYQTLMSSVVDWTYGIENAAHNTYLQILAENGIIGFLLFFGPVIYFLYRNLKRARESTAALVSSVALTVFLVHGLFDFQLMMAPQYLLLFAILFGLASQIALAPAAVSDKKP